MLHNLRSKSSTSLPSLPYDAVLVGKTISPSTLFELRASRVAGIVTETGSPLSHTAIVARSLELPAVMGVPDLSCITSGDQLIVNGTRGMVICNPDKSTLREYRQRTKPQRATLSRSAARVPTMTRDGIRISLGTNINFCEESQAAVDNGTESALPDGIDFFGREKLRRRLHGAICADSQSAAPATFRRSTSETTGTTAMVPDRA
jgi:phosphotransferase system enzyme I (PtsI)